MLRVSQNKLSTSPVVSTKTAKGTHTGKQLAAMPLREYGADPEFRPGFTLKWTAIAILAFGGPSFCPPFALGQEPPFIPDRTVIPITKVKVGIGGGTGIGPTAQFGTAFCLDLNCTFIGTNYHVAVATGSSLKIKGDKVIKRYLATSSDDEGATINKTINGTSLEFNLSRDFGIFELMEPLANQGMRGVGFSLDELEPSQEVDIYAYPLTNRLIPKRKLTKFPARFAGVTQDGILAFNYERSESGQSLEGGASGGLIIDRQTQQAVGVLVGVAQGTHIAAGISVQALADFMKRANPDLYAELFPAEVREHVASLHSLGDRYPRYIPTANLKGAIQLRKEESPEIKRLREKAQELADNIRDFIAIQTVEYGGMRRPPAPSQYEIRVIDGRQQFREYPDGNRELSELPFPDVNPILRPGSEWSTLPTLVGTELKLKIAESPDAIIAGRRLRVFKYRGEIEDNVCGFRTISDYVFFVRQRNYAVSCDGEVWTDEDFNIIRMSENDDLPPAAQWKNYHAVVIYGQLNRPEESTKLIPLSLAVQAELNGKTYWCRGRFTNYKVFSARSRLLSFGK